MSSDITKLFIIVAELHSKPIITNNIDGQHKTHLPAAGSPRFSG
jgi:hypothetical protein